MKKKVDLIPPDSVELTLRKIGSKIRVNRKTTYKNYEKFAIDHDFNKVSILRMEQGENFTIRMLIEVLHSMDISLEDFFKGIK